MSAKNTAELENELVEAEDMKKFLDDNEENFRQFTLAQYLRRLLAEKNFVACPGHESFAQGGRLSFVLRGANRP